MQVTEDTLRALKANVADAASAGRPPSPPQSAPPQSARKS